MESGAIWKTTRSGFRYTQRSGETVREAKQRSGLA